MPVNVERMNKAKKDIKIARKVNGKVLRTKTGSVST